MKTVHRRAMPLVEGALLKQGHLIILTILTSLMVQKIDIYGKININNT